MKKIPAATLLLILVNVSVFLWIYLGGHEIEAGIFGISPNVLRKGMFLPVLTYMFIHANIFHLLVNMFFIGDIGIAYENKIGSLKFILIYLFSGLFAGIVSALFVTALYFHSAQSIFVVGASGAAFGLLYYIFYLRNGFEVTIKNFTPIVVALHIPLFMLQIPVAWYAHAGGAVAGLALAAFIKPDKNLELDINDEYGNGVSQ